MLTAQALKSKDEGKEKGGKGESLSVSAMSPELLSAVNESAGGERRRGRADGPRAQTKRRHCRERFLFGKCANPRTCK